MHSWCRRSSVLVYIFKAHRARACNVKHKGERCKGERERERDAEREKERKRPRERRQVAMQRVQDDVHAQGNSVQEHACRGGGEERGAREQDNSYETTRAHTHIPHDALASLNGAALTLKKDDVLCLILFPRLLILMIPRPLRACAHAVADVHLGSCKLFFQS